MRFNFKACLVLLCAALALGGCYPSKVTDPNDPRFDVTKFSFEDYKTEDELLKTLNALFPEGTTKQKVDDVLLKSARLDMFQNVGPDGGIYIVYKKSKHDPSPNRPVKTARFLYNESHEVMDIETDFMDGKTPPKYLF